MLTGMYTPPSGICLARKSIITRDKILPPESRCTLFDGSLECQTNTLFVQDGSKAVVISLATRIQFSMCLCLVESVVVDVEFGVL